MQARDAVRRWLPGWVLALTAVTIGAGGCASTDAADTKTATTKPHLLALSTYAASLGEPVDAYMANPPPTNARKVELVFDGTYTRSGGGSETVKLVQPTSRLETSAVRWTSFGPFANPFTPKDADTGVFSGKVGVRVTMSDGSVVDDEQPIPIKFQVAPSVVVTELQPVTASCEKPALRLIGGMPYKLKTTTIGFKATKIDYSFRSPSIAPDASGRPVLDIDADGSPRQITRQLSHTMMKDVDVVDGSEAFVLPPVPIDAPSYTAVMSIVARDAQGRTVKSSFAMTAHNPIELFYDGRYELAQIYPPQPTSSCIPGGQTGRAVNYNETVSEARARTLNVTLSKSFMRGEANNWSTSDGKTVTTSTSNSDGWSRARSTTNAFSFSRSHSDTTGVSFNWSDGETIGGSAKVEFKPFGIGASAGVHGEKRWNRSKDQSSSSTDGWDQNTSTAETNNDAVNQSTATTDATSTSTTNTKGRGTSQAETDGEAISDAWTASSATSISRDFGGQVIANTYGVFYRQMARYTNRAFVVVYNKCGEGDVIGDVTLQDYVWAPDLALGESCPPLPVSNLPAAQCYMPPCDP